MKQLFLIFGFVCSGCFAQSPVFPLTTTVFDANTKGAYYQDTNNQLDPFVGTWEYTNGDTSLKITLQKKLMQEYLDGEYHFYHDILVGECKYIENGFLKMNTLSQLLLSQDPFKYSITGNSLFGQNMQYLRTSFKQFDVNVFGMETEMFFEKITENGIQKLKVTFRMTQGATYIESDGPPVVNFAIPFGTYIMIKQ